MYLDYIIVFSDSFEEHKKRLGQVLNALRDAGLSLKLSKCEFGTKSFRYLDHRIMPGRIGVVNKNFSAIQNAEFPKSISQMRAFIGMCNVYRHFVPNFARVAAPLTALTGKGNTSDLAPPDESQHKAFELLKKALVEPPILAMPNPDKPFSVDTDACEYQIGAAFFQENVEGERPLLDSGRGRCSQRRKITAPANTSAWQ